MDHKSLSYFSTTVLYPIPSFLVDKQQYPDSLWQMGKKTATKHGTRRPFVIACLYPWKKKTNKRNPWYSHCILRSEFNRYRKIEDRYNARHKYEEAKCDDAWGMGSAMPSVLGIYVPTLQLMCRKCIYII